MLACLKQSTYFHWLLNHFGEVKNILKNHVGFAQNKVPLTTFLYHCVIGVPACHFSFSFKLNEIELCWATFFRSCLRSSIPASLCFSLCMDGSWVSICARWCGKIILSLVRPHAIAAVLGKHSFIEKWWHFNFEPMFVTLIKRRKTNRYLHKELKKSLDCLFDCSF